MNSSTPILNFVLYGSQNSSSALKVYQSLINKLVLVKKATNLHLANPNNIDSLLKEIKGKTLFFPLFLMDGEEYNKLKSLINNNFPFENTLGVSLCHYPAFLKTIFEGNLNTIFLMHGSNRYNNWEQHKNIIKYGEALGYRNFCFLEGAPNYRDIISEKLLKPEVVKITPLFFITGHHIQNDLIDQFLNNYDKKKWQVNSCFLEREEIIEGLIKIISEALK